MSQERKKIDVGICEWLDDPEIKLRAALGRLSEDEIKEALELRVSANTFGYTVRVHRIAKALVRLSKPHWRLVLWIGSNGLVRVPESVWELANLEELQLYNNKLKTLSPAIAKLTKLRRLWIGDNPFQGFPEAVCQLGQLEELVVCNCQLSVLPASFASLRSLTELDLCDNAFEQFPGAICELRSLRNLWLYGNKLSSLPQSFANLRELRELCCPKNCFEEFPRVVCDLPNLERFDVWNNQLSELPLAITKLVRLKSLDLSRNSFTSFPLFLGDLPQLSTFISYGLFNLPVSISHSLAHNDAGNPLQGPRGGLDYDELLRFLQQRREIARLSAIVAGGFYCEESNAWTQFLVRGLYDPRLFLFIFDFAFDFIANAPKADPESSRKRGRYE